jgi:hypothetical protein
METMTGIKYEYKCSITGESYFEQRKPGEPQFFTKSYAGGDFILVSETEFTYEQEIPEAEVVETEEDPS